ncbi:protein-glutamate O-methyltransferase CheR [Duganella sp. BJB488]|uniref:CheR family methyltransferase n=1 Tax=unclassified Duganella TaxID=2636909 RepID=UPI000E351102|nr:MULTISPECIES: protein-glutamate O-methyltransferase CheR [unclassified Duganella]NVD72076.1 protein-glutamate O-methyltransferase CheR [Duganella sp. BJB1802]RFP24075.1 protein-glutamate O-methyltransferase CheR [Duganella sp. BJB489]RFP26438.1 protein-glutamate O-methyltransferase CheR [Duganella sp. BJB488]RFP34832.1 protein-glutamate O-methyltransferase CheR [Duganella sp. BJB480]
MAVVMITEREFLQFQRFIYEAAGICMANGKQALVSGRLAKRLAHYQLDSYGDYLRLLESRAQPAELQVAVDLLTTNETYFFREPKHFALLRELALEARDKRATMRVWSAASSSGEEAYSVAMVLADVLDEAPWEVLGTDISTRVLERARCGHYPIERASQMPLAYLKRYCLKGQGSEDGTLLVERPLRQRVQFRHLNLNEPLPKLGSFDVIFLRNVMIYFNLATKRQVVARLLALLRPGGYFLIGHSETLNDINDTLVAVAPSIYRKP